MKVNLISIGDESVGIPGHNIIIDLGMEIDRTNERNYIKAMLELCFAERWDTSIKILFEGEVGFGL